MAPRVFRAGAHAHPSDGGRRANRFRGSYDRPTATGSMTQLHLRRFTHLFVRGPLSGRAPGLATGALTTGSVAAALLWVTVAAPSLPLSRTVGIANGRDVQISLQSALLGIDERTGRISEAAAARAARRLGLVVTAPLLPTPARLHTLEQSASVSDLSAPVVTELNPVAVADQARIRHPLPSADTRTTAGTAMVAISPELSVASSPSSYDDTGATPVRWSGSDNATSGSGTAEPAGDASASGTATSTDQSSSPGAVTPITPPNSTGQTDTTGQTPDGGPANVPGTPPGTRCLTASRATSIPDACGTTDASQASSTDPASVPVQSDGDPAATPDPSSPTPGSTATPAAAPPRPPAVAPAIRPASPTPAPKPASSPKHSSTPGWKPGHGPESAPAPADPSPAPPPAPAPDSKPGHGPKSSAAPAPPAPQPTAPPAPALAPPQPAPIPDSTPGHGPKSAPTLAPGPSASDPASAPTPAPAPAPADPAPAAPTPAPAPPPTPPHGHGH